MEESIGDLANYIIEEIEREDFQHAYKRYGTFKIKKICKRIIEIWNSL